MALEKQPIPISFAQGRDGKTDPWQIAIGRFYRLNNSIFSKLGRLTKRYGNAQLATLSSSFDTKLMTTYQGGLLAVGNAINAFAQSSTSWVNKGSYLPLSLSVQPLIRSTASQNQCDVAISDNGLTCVAYSEVQTGVTSYKYSVFDSSGCAVVNATAIVPLSGSVSGSPRVFQLGQYFVVVFSTSNAHLQYFAIPITNPTVPLTAVDISTTYTAATTVAFDGVVANNNLYLAWNSSGGAGIKMMYLDTTLTAHTTVVVDASHQCTVMSVTADTTGATPVIWATYYNSSGTAGYTVAVSQDMTPVLTAKQIISAGTVLSITTVAQNQRLTTYYEVSNTYGYDSTLNSNYIQTLTVPQAGLPTVTITNASPAVFTPSSMTGLAVGTPIFFNTSGGLPTGLTAGTVYYISVLGATTFQVSATNPSTTTGGSSVNTSSAGSGTHTFLASSTLVRGMGLASKAFLMDSNPHFLSAYSSTNQPTYFLMNGSGLVRGKFAYENGGGYLALGLPSAVVSDTQVTIGYLFKDLIQAVNKTQGAASSSAVFSQTGINAITFDFDATPSTAEIGGALHLSGGQLWMYDGTQVVDHGFHLFPDNVKATWAAAAFTTTGTTVSGSAVLTGVASTAGVAAGMAISGTGIPASTTVLSFTANTITLSALCTASSGGITFTLGANGSIVAQPDGSTNTNAYFVSAVYEWMDAQGNIHRSAPSIPTAITTTGSASTGSITYNVPTMRATLKTLVKIILYRWSINQQTYYQVTSITSPTLNSSSADFVSVVDSAADSSIVGNSIIYTTGNVLGNDAAPATNLLALFDSRLFLVTAENENLLGFSKEVVDGTPVELSRLLTKWISPTIGAQGNTGDISMMAPMDDKMILFKSNAAIYYFNGEGPDSTGASNQYSQPIFIASPVSCTNPNVALIPSGLLFQSDKGIWRLGRNLVVSYDGAPVEDFNSQTVEAALVIPGTNQVRFMMSGGTQLMYDYFFEQWGTFTGIAAGSSTLYQSLQTTLDPFGRIFQETPGLYLDGSNPVLMSFTTGWIALAGIQGAQRAYWAFLIGQYLSPHKLTVGIALDYNPSVRQQMVITPDNYVPEWGGDSTWGSGSYWGGPGNTEQWQINFKQQSCQSFQITVSESFDASKGQAAGAGLTLSGLELVVGLNKRYPRRLPATRKTG